MTTEGSKKAILDLYRAVARETKNGAALGEQKEAFKHFLDENPPVVDKSKWVLPAQIRHGQETPQTEEVDPGWTASTARRLAKEKRITKIAILMRNGEYEKAARKLAKFADAYPEED